VVPSVVESGTELAGRYRLDRRLGVGGMGEVWQARDLKFERDLNLRRDVAIKLMHSTLTESDMLKRFQLEAKILSKLNHPHIVRMLDADWHEGQLFIVMELLADQDLGQLLSSSPRGLPVRRAVELARQLAVGLSVVHQRGIVHRDLKPANLFVQPGDLLKIGDFGIARDSSANSVLTAHGVIPPALLRPGGHEEPAAPHVLAEPGLDHLARHEATSAGERGGHHGAGLRRSPEGRRRRRGQRLPAVEGRQSGRRLVGLGRDAGAGRARDRPRLLPGRGGPLGNAGRG
jgi:serine/threonine protein kinase